jgi:hypothetical protein
MKLSKFDLRSLLFNKIYLFAVDFENLLSYAEEYLEIYWTVDFL